jgi:2-polyprenyl-3-methyl-5-hydroxy-6-metoxy-1,4-benzoquinol methylase
MIASARARTPEGRVSFVCPEFTAWSADEGAYDCILSAATLHHVDAGPALERMIRLLNPGGRLVIMTFDRPADSSIRCLGSSASPGTLFFV